MIRRPLSFFSSSKTCIPSADDLCTPRPERPSRQPRTLSVTIVGCSMGIIMGTHPSRRSRYGWL
jgi:hypothetical protein